MSVDARKERFELVEVFDRPMLFTCLRVDRNTVPKGLYLYEVRNDDDQCGIPVEIGRWIMVIIVPESFHRLIRSKRIFQNGSESLPTLLSVITLVGRKFVAHLHPAGVFTPDQECTC